MKQSFWKKYGFCLVTALLLALYTGYALLDTFVIPHSYQKVTVAPSGMEESGNASKVDGASKNAEIAGGNGASKNAEIAGGNGASKNAQIAGGNGASKNAEIAGGNDSSESGESTGGNGSSKDVGKKASHRGKEKGAGKGKGQDQNAGTGEETDKAAKSSKGNPLVTEDKSPEINEMRVTEDSYEDGNISVQISEYRENDTTIYVADILLTNPSYLKTAMAYDTYGKNVKAETSEIAQAHGAILAVNGDFYGARNEGYVIRQGVLYRDKSAGNEDLVIYKDGSFAIIQEGTVSAQTLLEQGAWNVLSFGPALLEDGELVVSEQDEVGRAMNSNPRTAVGTLGENHYVLVVSDGRTAENRGLSLYELAGFLKELGVETAYNLDGGGSSTMVFMDSLVNNPTSGLGQGERSVSDILYIGY